MLISLLSMAALAQSDAGDLGAPPITIRKEKSCECPTEIESGLIIIEGLVVDAEVTLAPDRLSVNDRQKTVFNVKASGDHDLKGRVNVWHSSNEKECGVTFDYGQSYKVVLRTLEDGAVETDQCLMKSVQEKDE